MPKGTSRAEAMSNGEKIKPIALAIVELRLSEGTVSYAISQLLGLSVTQSVEDSIK